LDLEIDPEQPESVVVALGAALSEGSAGPDPWWQAGLEEALET
jgi:hypothetical protein